MISFLKPRHVLFLAMFLPGVEELKNWDAQMRTQKIRLALEETTRALGEIQGCEHIYKKWTLAQKRLLKLGPLELQEEIKDPGELRESEQGCQELQDSLVKLIKMDVYSRKMAENEFFEKLENLP